MWLTFAEFVAQAWDVREAAESNVLASGTVSILPLISGAKTLPRR
jgi:hypothetical protein